MGAGEDGQSIRGWQTQGEKSKAIKWPSFRGGENFRHVQRGDVWWRRLRGVRTFCGGKKEGVSNVLGMTKPSDSASPVGAGGSGESAGARLGKRWLSSH